jgi:hypothetical protein
VASPPTDENDATYLARKQMIGAALVAIVLITL